MNIFENNQKPCCETPNFFFPSSFLLLSFFLVIITFQNVIGQNDITSQCYFDDDTNIIESIIGMQNSSENGYVLPASGTLRVLVVFAEIEYADPNYDPNLMGTSSWPVNNLPVWADDLFDVNPSTNPQGLLTKYFYEASSGGFTLLGDYLVHPLNGIFTIPNGGQNVTHQHLITLVNNELNGVFTTNEGLNPQDFDFIQTSSAGQVKLPSTGNPIKYDHVMFIWRNLKQYVALDQYGNPIYRTYDGSGNMSLGGFSSLLLGHRADTHSNLGQYNDIPLRISRHEFAHAIMGGNTFHSCGGGVGNFESDSRNYWIPRPGGHSLLGLGNSALECWNSWDRYRLGWKNPNNINLISCRSANGTAEAVQADLDALISSHEGIYVLRDFVSTGDALRIKLPFLDPDNEFQQWLWIENHRGYSHNGNIFDKYILEEGTANACIDPVEWGLTLSIQIDKEKKFGANIYSGHLDYIRQISAEGLWEREFDPWQQDGCVPWTSYNYPSRKLLPNALTGYDDLDRYPYDLDGNDTLTGKDEILISSEIINNVKEDKVFTLGNPRQMFRLAGNSQISIGTNPSSANHMNQVGYDMVATNVKNVRRIYLNGIKIKILEMMSNGSIKVEIKFDQTDVEEDVRWCAPDIVLNQIVPSPGYSLNLKSGKLLHLDHGTAATKMTNPITFEGEQVFTDPTVMRVKNGAFINLESGSELLIDRNSSLVLESGSRIDVQSGATIRIRRDGLLHIMGFGILNVQDGGRVVIEGADGDYGSGILRYDEYARINLNTPTSVLDVSGTIEIGDNAHFRLGFSLNTNKTHGKIIFRQGNSTEVIAGVNAHVDIRGHNQSQVVMENYKTHMEFPSNLTSFTLLDMAIKQDFGARLTPPKSNSCSILVKNILFTSFQPLVMAYHSGLRMYGQANATIQNCIFEYATVGVHADNSLLESNLKISDCISVIQQEGCGFIKAV